MDRLWPEKGLTVQSRLQLAGVKLSKYTKTQVSKNHLKLECYGSRNKMTTAVQL